MRLARLFDLPYALVANLLRHFVSSCLVIQKSTPNLLAIIVISQGTVLKVSVSEGFSQTMLEVVRVDA